MTTHPTKEIQEAPTKAAAMNAETMKAVVYQRFGSPDVMDLREVPIPAVAADEVLVEVRAASVNPWDWHFMRGLPYIARLNGAGLRRPKHPVLGGDIAGVVRAIGSRVSRLAPGDEVFGFIGFGGFAEFASAPERQLAAMPSGLTFKEAAAVPLAGMTALQGLRDVGGIQEGDRVLILGASGGVGTFAVQLAKHFGAGVTAVCSGRNAEVVRSIGADAVIDYTVEDVANRAERYDLILQLAGTTPPSGLRRLLTPHGRLVLSSGDATGQLVGPMGRMVRGLMLSPLVSQSIRVLSTKPKPADLHHLGEIHAEGHLTPVLDSTYTLADVPEAIRHQETGHPRGKVVIAVPDRSKP